MEQASGKRYQISPDFVLREVAGESVIVPLGNHPVFANTMMTPNKTAAFLWQAFSQPSSEDDVVARVLERFDGTEESVRADVRRFIEQSLKMDVMTEVDEK